MEERVHDCGHEMFPGTSNSVLGITSSPQCTAKKNAQGSKELCKENTQWGWAAFRKGEEYKEREKKQT